MSSPSKCELMPRQDFIAKNKRLHSAKIITPNQIRERIEQAILKRKFVEELNFKKFTLQQVKWDLVRAKRRQL